MKLRGMQLAGYRQLFDGRDDVYGADLDSGGVGPVKLGALSITSAMLRHLRGELSMGVYPMVDNRVRWGCVDLDEGEEVSWEHARNVKRVLSAFSIEAWIERSRSKGYHVWVFASDWVDAKAMRALLLGACDVAGAPTKEVNPKQDSLEDGQLGNFVRLPYHGALHGPTRRQVIVDRVGEPFPFDVFVDRAMRHWTEPVRLEAARHSLFLEPAVPVAVIGSPEVTSGVPWWDRLNRLASLQLRYGPRQTSQDRSAWLYSLGLSCAESGLDHFEIVEALRRADRTYTGKYADRRDAERRYEDIATKAMREVMEAW